LGKQAMKNLIHIAHDLEIDHDFLDAKAEEGAFPSIKVGRIHVHADEQAVRDWLAKYVKEKLDESASTGKQVDCNTHLKSK
jgi:hypothetical protein